MYRIVTLLVGWSIICLLEHSADAAEPVTLESYVAPSANVANEPVAAAYSKSRAINFLDSAALHWQEQHACMTCHTNYAYLYARPSIDADAPAHKAVRAFAEQLVTKRWETKGPRWDAEVIATAAALSFNDAADSGKLHPVTRQALDRMWTVQRNDGGWSWLKCGWPPMESDDHYGATLAAIAVGVAPDGYAESPNAKEGMAKLRDYFDNHPPQSLHHRMMLLWADSYVDDLVSERDKSKCLAELASLQRPDGGWALASLGNWKRADGSNQDTATSDGYATGFAIYVMRRAGFPADHKEIKRGVRWLKTNQRVSGRWFTRSLHSDGSHYISHAGTAMSIMALAQCNQLD